MEDCIFCKIVGGELPSQKVYEDNEILAFKDIHPLAPVHILVIPKKHISKLADATEGDAEILGKIQLIAAKLAKENGIGDAFRVLNANGKDAGQSVFHIHYHLRGGWKGGVPEDK